MPDDNFLKGSFKFKDRFVEEFDLYESFYETPDFKNGGTLWLWEARRPIKSGELLRRVVCDEEASQENDVLNMLRSDASTAFSRKEGKVVDI